MRYGSQARSYRRCVEFGGVKGDVLGGVFRRELLQQPAADIIFLFWNTMETDTSPFHRIATSHIRRYIFIHAAIGVKKYTQWVSAIIFSHK